MEDRGDYPADAYVAALEADGVAAALLFPSVGLGTYQTAPSEILTPIARTYNDWLLKEFCAYSPEQLKGAAMINVDNIDDAIAEMNHSAKNGAACFLFPVDPAAGSRYDEPRYDRLWGAAASLGLPVVLHVQAMRSIQGRAPVFDLLRHASLPTHLQMTLAELALSGVLARHPNLKIGAVEFGASWMPYLMEQVDAAYLASSDRANLGGALPSDLLRRSVFLVFQEDPAAIALRDRIGMNRMLWGNDFPHAESTFPCSEAVVARQLTGVSAEEAHLFTAKNAAELFGFSLARLSARQGESRVVEVQQAQTLLM
jgi:predicted TIM-barrel fold metal-dependent hydrolase